MVYTVDQKRRAKTGKSRQRNEKGRREAYWDAMFSVLWRTQPKKWKMLMTALDWF